jgi:hypothetical protein
VQGKQRMVLCSLDAKMGGIQQTVGLVMKGLSAMGACLGCTGAP